MPACAGAIGMADDLDVLVKAADLLKDRADIRILIVGEGKERNRLQEMTAAGNRQHHLYRPISQKSDA